MSSLAALTGQCQRSSEWRANNLEKQRERARQWNARRRERWALSREYDDVMSEHEGEATSLLYLMRYEFDPCGTMGVKIGRTKNLASRVEQMERAQKIRMKVLRVYNGMGNLEPIVKDLLKSRRANQGAGTEWYDVSFATAMRAVALARSLGPDDDLNEAASALSELSEESST